MLQPVLRPAYQSENISDRRRQFSSSYQCVEVVFVGAISGKLHLILHLIDLNCHFAFEVNNHKSFWLFLQGVMTCNLISSDVQTVELNWFGQKTLPGDLPYCGLKGENCFGTSQPGLVLDGIR
jgi:hypothetical protein